jgi:hypothetical protein
LTERVSTGIISSKHLYGVVTLVVAAAVLVSVAGCAQKGSPVEPDDGGGYRVVATLAIAGYAEDVEVTGALCLIAAGQGGLVLADLSNPAAPEYLGTGGTSYEATGCAYAPSDTIAFVTNGTSGILAFDVSDPSEPVQIGNGQAQQARDVVVVEVTPGELHHLFVADGLGGFQVQEFRYYSAYQAWFFGELDHHGPVGSARGVCLAGSDIALVAKEQLGLWVYDTTVLTDVVVRGTVDTPGEARAVVAAGDHAYIADWRAGLQVVDISDPSSPEIVASVDMDGLADGICYYDGKVYVAAHTGGLRVFDVSDPADPQAAGFLETPFANGVFVTDSYVYVADRDWGLVVAEEE